MAHKFQRSAKFKHLLWRRHRDDAWLHGCRPEILASDGQQVRRLTSQPQHIALQTLNDEPSAIQTAQKIEASVSQGVALMGYSMFDHHDAVAILHTAPDLEPGWVAFPHRRTSNSLVPTLPHAVADAPTIRLACAAALKWHKGKLHIAGLIEQREDEGVGNFNLAAHVREWSVSAWCGAAGEARELSICRDVYTIAEPPTGGALRHIFLVDEVVWRMYEADPSLTVWFTLRFDRELFCLPDDWLRLWTQVALQR